MKFLVRIQRVTIVRIRSSKVFRNTNFSYLFGGGSWLVLEQLVTYITSLLLTIAFANLLVKEDYGVFKYVLSIATLLSVTALPGIFYAVMRGVARGNDGIYLTGLYARIKWGLLGSVIALGFSAFYFFVNSDLTLTVAFLIVALITPLWQPFTSYNAYLSGKMHFKRKSFYNVASETGSFAVVALLLFFSGNLILTIFAYFFTRTLFALLITLLTIYRYHPKAESLEKESGALTFGKHMSIMTIISTFAGHADNVIVMFFLGPTQVAVYAIAILPVRHIHTLFFRTARPLLVPKYSQQDMRYLQKNLLLKSILIFFVLALVTFLYIIFATQIFKLIFPNYLASIPYTKLAALYLLGTPFTIFYLALISQGKHKALYTQRIITYSLGILGMVVLTYLYGIWGMVIAQVLISYVSSLTQTVLFQMAKTSNNTEVIPAHGVNLRQ